MPLCCSLQLKHPDSSRVLEGSSNSGLHGRAFLQGTSPELKLGKETQSPSCSSSLSQGNKLYKGLSPPRQIFCHQDTLPAKHGPSNTGQAWWHPVPSARRGAGRYVLGVRNGRQQGLVRFVGEARTEIALHKMTRATWPFYTACPAPKPAGAG